MANFIPLKNYMFYCLDNFIDRYKLAPPFLDVGCGIGDLSIYLAKRGWQGEAVDSSEVAVKRATQNLKPFPAVKVSKKSLFEESGHFKTIYMWDVLEHIKDDEVFLEKASSLLVPSGYLLIAVPSNGREWGWDDDFYGHYRRYSKEEMTTKLISAGLEPVVWWDFTYPFFWLMRRFYIYFKSQPKNRVDDMDKDQKTKLSSTVNAWETPFISNFLNKENFLWRLLYKI